MQLRALVVSGWKYCGSSVVASPERLSRIEPYAKNAGQPFGQPFAAASLVGCVFSCVTTTYAFVAFAPVKLGNIAPMFGCACPRGCSGWVKSLPICVFVLPSNSFTRSVVDESCDAFTRPMLLR